MEKSENRSSWKMIKWNGVVNWRAGEKVEMDERSVRKLLCG